MALMYPEGRIINFTAGEAISAKNVVYISSAGTVKKAGADSTKVVGVALMDASSGDPVPVATHGVVKVVASGAISVGAKVAADNGGKVKAWSASSAGDSAKIIGIALEAASDDGDEIMILLTL